MNMQISLVVVGVCEQGHDGTGLLDGWSC